VARRIAGGDAAGAVRARIPLRAIAEFLARRPRAPRTSARVLRRPLRILVVAAAAVLTHLPAHVAPWSSPSGRELLPDDGPAFVGNLALGRADGEGLAAASVRAAGERSAATPGADASVGVTRWRPVATTAFVTERSAPWAGTQEGAAAGAALVSLALHVLVALGAMRLTCALGGDGRASLLAGLLAAVTPVALSSSAWPARQPAMLAAALGTAGLLLTLRGGAARLLLGGVALALAGLAHEAAFGLVLAVPLLRAAVPRAGGDARAPWPWLVAPAAAFVARWCALGALTGADATPAAPDALASPNFIDGLTGVVRAFVAFAVPSRPHFADAPYTFPFAVHAFALALLVAGGVYLFRRRREPAAASALAAGAALLVVPAALLEFPAVHLFGVGIAPYQDAYATLVLPLLAASVALAASRAVAAGGTARVAAASAAAMLVGASVAATVSAAPAFRSRSAFIDLALQASPRSELVRTWDLARRGSGDVEAMRSVAAEVGELAADAGGRGAARLRRDAAGSGVVANFLSQYAGRAAASRLPLSDRTFDAAEASAVAVTRLRPKSARAWAELAQLRRSTGALRGAVDAASQAIALAPDELGIVQLGADIAIAVGQGRYAADAMDRALEKMRAGPQPATPSPEFSMLYARALAADGNLLVPDPLSDRGVRFRYDLAAEVLEALRRTPGVAPAATNELLYDVYIRYGDLLATVDRPAMARLAYGRALELVGGNAKSDAAEHARWLVERLKSDEARAAEHLAEAQAKDPAKVADAYVEVYIAICRQSRWDEADALFAELSQKIGSTPPELRLVRAVQRYAALEDADHQGTAESELRQVLQEKDIPRARFELARVLEWQGTDDRLREALGLYEQAARDGALEDWSLDAAERADAVAGILRRSGK
jgi:tetratricopeptide (TPR) repeat protein